jgi:uncharacterized protein YecT (DUF1311 family)
MAAMSIRAVSLVFLLVMLPIPLAVPQVTRSYIDEGERHYAAVLGRPADPCPDDRTVSHEMCMDKELTFVEPHLDGFIAALRGVLTAKAASPKSGAQSELQTLNKADAAWRRYRAQICRLEFDYFASGSGTIGVPARADCELRMDRAYMEQLHELLHLQQVVR